MTKLSYHPTVKKYVFVYTYIYERMNFLTYSNIVSSTHWKEK